MNLNKTYDYIIVGSGCTGAQAAQTLVEHRQEVLLLDVGNQNDSTLLFPNNDFLSIRKETQNQQELFLGKTYNGIPWGEIKPGYHLTPQRKYIVKDVSTFLPYSSDTFQPFESLAKGGLGAAWGTGSYVFSNDELSKCGLHPDEMQNHYRTLFKRIGITKGNQVSGFEEQEPLETDRSCNSILKTYSKKKNQFNKKRVYLHRTPLAVITKDKKNRKKYQYKDMDFWHDQDKSAYRPWITIDELQGNDYFNYKTNALVTRFKEIDGIIKVEVLNTKTNETTFFNCKKLLLGASVFGTTRIVLRSFNLFEKKVPFLCNSYYYIPCINLKMFGKRNSQKKISFSQLTLEIIHKNGIEIANFFTYRSLLLFRLVKESPLNIKTSRLIFKFLQSCLVIVGFHISKSKTGKSVLTLKKNQDSILGDKLSFTSETTSEEKKSEKNLIKKLQKVLFQLRCIPLKKIKTPDGSSIHYAGTLPFSKKETLLTTNKTGRLHKTKNVYIIDASTFTFLPAKGVTLTAMANAHRIALNTLKND